MQRLDETRKEGTQLYRGCDYTLIIVCNVCPIAISHLICNRKLTCFTVDSNYTLILPCYLPYTVVNLPDSFKIARNIFIYIQRVDFHFGDVFVFNSFRLATKSEGGKFLISNYWSHSVITLQPHSIQYH